MKFQAALGAALVVMSMLFGAGLAQATTVPAGFSDETVIEGLSNPTMVRFAPDGRVFVAEKGGKILVYENLQDKTPEVFANLSKPIYDFEDHGLLGIALDPDFETGSPYVYAIYTFNHELTVKGTQEPLVSNPESVTPAWASGGPGFENDKCPESEQVTKEEGEGKEAEEKLGCEVSGLVVRMEAENSSGEYHAAPSAEEPAQKVLLEGWCQQSTTHSIGNIGFGPEGNLFVSGGEGSMFSKADYGEFGNPCEDPYQAPHGVDPDRRSSALGGSLRAQSVLRDHSLPGHETLLSGTVLRVNKMTGEGVPGNPFASSIEKNARRIIGFGFRQPWRFAFNPRTSKLFVDNVGDGTYEEMDRLELDGAADYGKGDTAYNSGWPCYEGGPSGPHRNEHYTYASEPFPTLQYCIDMYEAEENGESETSAPFYSYEHSGPIVPDDSCDPAPTLTDIGGISFYEGSNYPAAYKNSLFFADPIRGCIYVMKAGPDGEPDPATVSTFVYGKTPFSFPGIDIEQGPEGEIFYTEFDSGPGAGTVHRITHEETQEEKETHEREERETHEREERETHEREERETHEREERETREREVEAHEREATEAHQREEREAREREEARKAEEAHQPPTQGTTPTNPGSPPPGGAGTAPTPPGAPKLSHRPAKTTRLTTAKFTFGAAPGLTFRCSLDGKPFSRCSSPRTYKHLAVGPHFFRVFAVDLSGNRATVTTKYRWTLKPRS